MTSGQGDIAIKFGEAELAGGAYSLALASDPPPAAINSYGVAVGLLILFEAGTELPVDGQQPDFDALEPSIRGFGDYIEVIWKGPGVGDPPSWADGFDDGYDCGRCVLAPEGGDNDSFVPTACTAPLTVEEHLCDWT